jgi:hypothetical protein
MTQEDITAKRVNSHLMTQKHVQREGNPKVNTYGAKSPTYKEADVYVYCDAIESDLHNSSINIFNGYS